MSSNAVLRKAPVAVPAVLARQSNALGVFAASQAGYAARGIATFPVRLAQGVKRPAVKGYMTLGIETSQKLAFRFPASNVFGFALGRRSRITVLDIDTQDERTLADALSRHGATPIVVRSGSGNWQAWYRFNSEGRLIRPWPNRPIDLLGGGYVVAPPSHGLLRSYAFVEGGLDDLDRLPILRDVELPPARANPQGGMAVPQGERNSQLWRHCMKHAPHCDDVEALIDVALTFNQNCDPPLSDNEVSKTAASAWGYQLKGKNWFGSRGMVAAPKDLLHRLEADAFYLLMRLREAHVGLRGRFAIAIEPMSEALNWDRRRLRKARDALLDAEAIELVHRGGRCKGDASVYRFTDVLVPTR